MFATTLLFVFPSPVPPACPVQDPPIFDLRSEGVEALLPAPPDAGLRRVLELAGPRLFELAGGSEIPPELVDLAVRAALGPLHVCVRELRGEAPFAIQAEARFDDDVQALMVARELRAAFEDAGADLVQESATVWRVDESPAGWIGAGGDVALFAFGALTPPAAGPARASIGPELPGGLRAAVSGRVDVARLLDLAADFGAEVPLALRELGSVEFAYGTDAERGHAAVRVEGGAAFVTAPAALAALRLVPPDATWASVGTSNYALAASLLQAEGGGELFEHVDHYLGETQGSYVAPSTGGGGLFSTVHFAEAESAERLEELWTSLPDRIHAAVGEPANGRVAVRRAEQDGAPLLLLTFPGLPVPVEPALTHDGSTLFLGLTPQTALAARAHALSGGPGLDQDPGFRAQLPPNLDRVVSIAFVDTPGLMGAGYGPACLLGAALANAVRSPADEARDAGLVIPPFAELSAGARPIVTVVRVVGQDLLVETRCDRSIAVNVAGLAGVAASDPSWILLGSLATLVAPQIAQATRAAGRTRVLADLRALETAAENYAMRNNGRFPDDLEVLVTADEYGNAYIQSATVPLDPWGNEYRYDPPTGGGYPRIYTYGADGIPGGVGEDADVSTDAFR